MAARSARLDTWLASIFGARVLMYANFMVYAACLPVLMAAWEMNATQAGTIVSGFMAAYAVSLFVCSWLADRYGAKKIFLWSACLSALTALLFGLFARSYWSGLLLYALAASTQGGLYTPAIMLLSDRYQSNRLGTVMGYLIASTSVGYAFSLVVSGLLLKWSGYRGALIATGVLPVIGAVLTWLALRSTENVIHPRMAGVSALKVFRLNRDARYLTAGYTCHSWELLGMWAWTPTFFAASFALSNYDFADTAQFGAYLTALMHVVGSLASASMGWLSDHLGRRLVLIGVAGLAALLSFGIGWMITWPIAILSIVGLFYYFTALGDSPVLSAALSEAVEPAYLGSVLAVRALLGFGAGAIAPIVFGVVLDWTNPQTAGPVTEWGWAFVTLGMGGLMAMIFAVLYKGDNTS